MVRVMVGVRVRVRVRDRVRERVRVSDVAEGPNHKTSPRRCISALGT